MNQSSSINLLYVEFMSAVDMALKSLKSVKASAAFKLELENDIKTCNVMAAEAFNVSEADTIKRLTKYLDAIQGRLLKEFL